MSLSDNVKIPLQEYEDADMATHNCNSMIEEFDVYGGMVIDLEKKLVIHKNQKDG